MKGPNKVSYLTNPINFLKGELALLVYCLLTRSIVCVRKEMDKMLVHITLSLCPLGVRVVCSLIKEGFCPSSNKKEPWNHVPC